MIDTDKYEGHTEGHKEGSWDIYEVYGSDNKLMKCIRPLHDKWGVDLPLVASKDAQLIADAPLLLAEVERLREDIKSYLNLEIETHELKELIE